MSFKPVDIIYVPFIYSNYCIPKINTTIYLKLHDVISKRVQHAVFET